MAETTILITGAARRIGANIAHTLHTAGMRVVLHYRHSAGDAERLSGEFNQIRPASAAVLQADLRNAADLSSLISRAAGLWGRLDVLINNASVFFETPIGRVTESEWDDLMDTNLKAPFFLCQAAAPFLREHAGCIINIVDIHAERPLKGYPVYSIAKAALTALTRALARELGPEIRVNGIAPGAILWPENGLSVEEKSEILARIPLKRSGAPDDIGRAVLFLVNDARYVTGQILTVDGGRTLFG